MTDPSASPGWPCWESSPRRTLSNKTVKLFLSFSLHVNLALFHLTQGNMAKTSSLCTFTFTTESTSLYIWGWEMGSVTFLLGPNEASKWLLPPLKIPSLSKLLLFEFTILHLTLFNQDIDSNCTLGSLLHSNPAIILGDFNTHVPMYFTLAFCFIFVDQHVPIDLHIYSSSALWFHTLTWICSAGEQGRKRLRSEKVSGRMQWKWCRKCRKWPHILAHEHTSSSLSCSCRNSTVNSPPQPLELRYRLDSYPHLRLATSCVHQGLTRITMRVFLKNWTDIGTKPMKVRSELVYECNMAKYVLQQNKSNQKHNKFHYMFKTRPRLL